MVPSVFVAFHCLAEPPPLVAVSGPGEAAQFDGSGLEASSMEELKAKDEELIKTIAERKRGLVERGIKLTVVLLTSRSMLENPQLEARLSYLRRSSGLDSKASLFVLTPVSRPELGEFVTSLQGALYDSSLDFYREHVRRIRRKRPRYPPPFNRSANPYCRFPFFWKLQSGRSFKRRLASESRIQVSNLRRDAR